MLMEYTDNIHVKDVEHLAEAFDLPVVYNLNELTVIGEQKFLVFKLQENDTCQLIQIC